MTLVASLNTLCPQIGTGGELQLKTGVSLDFETCSQYTVKLVAELTASSFLECDLTIAVKDENDVPAFPASLYSFDVVEGVVSGSPVGTPVVADDADEGDELSYTITAGNDKGFFKIGACSGQLSIVEEGIDYEEDTSFSLTIVVTDGIATDTTSVALTVLNVNDPPTFAQALYSLEVPENMPDGTAIGPVLATDTDGDALEYSLSRNSDRIFTIGASDGILRLARPAGIVTNPLFSEVPDRLVDWYDNQPGISMVHSFDDGGSYTITTSSATGRPGIVHYNTDVDGCVPYTLAVTGVSLVGTARLYIHANSGELLWPGPALPDTVGTAEYQFVVPCSDAWIRVGVLLENPTAGDSFQLFSVVLSRTDAYVPLSSESAVNFEVKNQYDVTVHASDGKGGEAEADVSVRVTNGNDEPSFTPPSPVVLEDAIVGTAVGSLLIATDEDVGTEFTWTLMSHTDVFSLSADGQLTLIAPLDYAVTPSFDVVVNVTDNGIVTDARTKSTVQTMTVTVANRNDAPVISNQVRAVDENLPADTAVGAPLDATDPDNGGIPNSVQTLLFYLVGGDTEKFRLDPSTGQLYTRVPLDYETAAGHQHSVQVTVRDSGSPLPQLTSPEATVTVDIGDTNEDPVFTTQFLSVAENSPAATQVGSALVCTDPDAGDDASLVFDITRNAFYGSAAAPNDMFTINTTSGQVYLAGSASDEATWPPTDAESVARLMFEVSCSDQRGGVTEAQMYVLGGLLVVCLTC